VPSHRADTPPLTRVRAQQRRRSGRRATQRSKASSLSVSHVSILGALGLATIAAPISGVLSVPAPAKAALNEIAAPSVDSPAFPFREQLPRAVARVSLVPDDQRLPSVPKTLAAPRDVLVREPSSRSHERAVLPGCNGEFPLLKVDNGRLPASMLCTIWDGEHQLRPDAAVSLARLNVAYTQEFGHPMCVSDGYRTLSEQYAVKAQRGWLAARAGTSNHGKGVAVDLCDDVENSGSRTHAWMVDNAPLYDWTNPDWAQRGGSGPFEPWHWEFTPTPGDGGDATG
jgi:hypothetical protein